MKVNVNKKMMVRRQKMKAMSKPMKKELMIELMIGSADKVVVCAYRHTREKYKHF